MTLATAILSFFLLLNGIDFSYSPGASEQSGADDRTDYVLHKDLEMNQMRSQLVNIRAERDTLRQRVSLQINDLPLSPSFFLSLSHSLKPTKMVPSKTDCDC